MTTATTSYQDFVMGSLAMAAYRGLAVENGIGDDSNKYPIPDGWENLKLDENRVTSAQLANDEVLVPGVQMDPTLGGFFGTAFVNKQTKQVVIAFRGSSTGDALTTGGQLTEDARADWIKNNLFFFADDFIANVPGIGNVSAGSVIQSAETFKPFLNDIAAATTAAAATIPPRIKPSALAA